MTTPFYTLDEVAAIVRIHIRTARRWADAQRPPFDGAFKDGRAWKVPRSSVEAYMRRRLSRADIADIWLTVS